ncbi:hypothetical protein JCM11641_001920 [Rhodosporidiobolus odoratus]
MLKQLPSLSQLVNDFNTFFKRSVVDNKPVPLPLQTLILAPPPSHDDIAPLYVQVPLPVSRDLYQVLQPMHIAELHVVLSMAVFAPLPSVRKLVVRKAEEISLFAIQKIARDV